VLDDAVSALASGARLGSGSRCRVATDRGPIKALTLYNMEGSPYCRKVREALSELDLEYRVRNVPKGSPKRAELARHGGKVMVPYLVDPNTGRQMYESDDIVAYLEEHYSEARTARPTRSARSPKSTFPARA
jgi:glutathione S-transferase